MLRSLMRFALPLVAVTAALGGIWPDQLGEFKRVSAAPVTVTDRALWDEYGLDQAERAAYEAGAKKFIGTAWRLKDSTGAFAAFQWQRPADGRPSKVAELAVETPKEVVAAYGNYLLRFEGWRPQVTDLAALIDRLPKLEKSPLPTLAGYLPTQGLLPNSERYILGPVSLERFWPGIPPSLAAFHMGAEGQMGRFRWGSSEMDLIIFSYPTPHIARDQLAAFQKLPGATPKRAGPLVALILSPPDPDAAERLLSLVRYKAEVTLSEYVPTRRDNLGDLILNIFILTGILVVFCAVAGLAYGGTLAAIRRWRGGPGGDEPMIMLHLEDR
jgi:hypothetical protein